MVVDVQSGGRGQASVEIIALVPLLIVIAVAGVQLGVTAHAWGMAREAARAGARAALVGAPADDAARLVLGPGLRQGAIVREVTRRDGERRVTVRVLVPMLLPWVPAVRVGADASVDP